MCMKKSKKEIIASLSSEEKSFAELLDETGLARSTLSTSIKELLNENVIERKEDSKDRRIKYYRLVDPSKVEKVRHDTWRNIEKLLGDLEKLIDRKARLDS